MLAPWLKSSGVRIHGQGDAGYKKILFRASQVTLDGGLIASGEWGELRQHRFSTHIISSLSSPRLFSRAILDLP